MLSNGHSANDFQIFGIAGIATMVGLFIDQATKKLKEVFDTLFNPKEPDKLPDVDGGRA